MSKRNLSQPKSCTKINPGFIRKKKCLLPSSHVNVVSFIEKLKSVSNETLLQGIDFHHILYAPPAIRLRKAETQNYKQCYGSRKRLTSAESLLLDIQNLKHWKLYVTTTELENFSRIYRIQFYLTYYSLLYYWQGAVKKWPTLFGGGRGWRIIRLPI